MPTPKVGDAITVRGVPYTITELAPAQSGATHVKGVEVLPPPKDGETARAPNRVELNAADLTEVEGKPGLHHVAPRVVYDDTADGPTPMAEDDPRWARFPEGSPERKFYTDKFVEAAAAHTAKQEG